MTNFMKIQTNGLVLIALVLFASACQQKAPVKRTAEWVKVMKNDLILAKTERDERLRWLKTTVKKEGMTKEGLEQVKRAELLKKRTSLVTDLLDNLQDIISKEAGGGLDPKTQLPKTPQNTKEVERIMTDNHAKLVKALDDYTVYLNREYKDLELPRFERFTKGINYPKKMSDYEVFYKGTTVSEALASLISRQLVVLRFESEVLKKLGGEEKGYNYY